MLLTPDVKETMGATYRITAKYDAPVAEARAGTISRLSAAPTATG
ncbi:MAG: hypothetical protein ACLRMJ_10390 [Alistipes finegoldii]